MFKASGKPADTEATMKERIKTASFTNVHENLYSVLHGARASSLPLKEVGRFNEVQFKYGVEASRFHGLDGGWLGPYVYRDMFYVLSPSSVNRSRGAWRKSRSSLPRSGRELESASGRHIYCHYISFWAQKLPKVESAVNNPAI